MKVTYVDLPALAETFSDRIGNSLFDGQYLRVDLLVTRAAMNPTVANPDAMVVPVARLVLTKEAAEDLREKIGKFLKSLDPSGQTKQ
jgi:hypothetical protein